MSKHPFKPQVKGKTGQKEEKERKASLENTHLDSVGVFCDDWSDVIIWNKK